MSEVLTGKISQIRFFSEETAFIVMNVETSELERPVLMTGYMPDYSEQLSYRFTGEFTVHPKYGKQFKIESYEVMAMDDKEATIRYLSSSLFHGIGPVLASQIVDHLGADALEKITANPDVLDHIRGMTAERKAAIYEVLSQQSQQQKTLQFLMGHGLSLKIATKIIGVYPENAIEIVEENPYALAENVEGIGFKMADEVAQSLNFPKDHPYRLAAAMLSVIKQECMNRGSTFLSYEMIAERFLKLFSFVDDPLAVLENLKKEEKIIQEEDRYYPESLYYAEKLIADVLKRYIAGMSNPDYDFEDVEEGIETLEETWNIAYDESQRDAIYSFLENDLMILSGGPGTGKTTIVKAMLALYRKIEPGKKIALVAPTGRAAKRLSEACDLEATTIHRLLKWDVYTNTFNQDEEHPIDADLLIIDEFSMVDTFLFSRLLAACGQVTKILMIGDEAQLPSIAPGQVLYDLIETGQIECVFLKHIFRQQSKSGIISVSHALRNDELDALNDFSSYSDIHFMPCREQDVVRFVSRIIGKAIDEGYDLYDFQVLSPMYQGAAGIDAINEALQELINPKENGKNEVRIYQHIFREGDKVLQLKNRPDDNVFNGDIGIVIEIQKRDGFYYQQDKIIVDFEGDIVEYTSQDFNQLTLAYCMSIHKAQGSEFKIVVMPLVSRHGRMLRKNLIYTGMTRAKQALFLIGEKNALTLGASRNENRRMTTLQQRFKKNDEISPYDFMNE